MRKKQENRKEKTMIKVLERRSKCARDQNRLACVGVKERTKRRWKKAEKENKRRRNGDKNTGNGNTE